jgi:hypothetical protein
MNPYEFAWSTWALGRMRVQYGSLPSDCVNSFPIAAENVISKMEEREVGVTLWGLGRIQGIIIIILVLSIIINNNIIITIPIAPVNEFSLEMRNILFQGIENIINAKLATLQLMPIINNDEDDNIFNDNNDTEDTKQQQNSSRNNARIRAFKRLTQYLDDVGISWKQLDVSTQKKLLSEAINNLEK